MKKLSRWMILLGIILIVGTVSAFILPGESTSPDASDYPFWTSFHSTTVDLSPVLSENNDKTAPPTPNRNPCLHCHIVGYEDGALTPLWRWLGFGTMGLIFLFGITRSLSTWNTREQWKPIRVRIKELVNTSDPLGRELDAPAPKWVNRVWYALAGVTLAFFVVQGISGVINAYHIDPLIFDPEVDTHAQLVLGIRNIHWVVGIFLLVAALGFNLIGSLLKSELRSYWVTMLIIGGAFGIPAIVQLTIGYLDPEVITPVSHLFALHAVLIAALAASIAAMYYIITYKPKEE